MAEASATGSPESVANGEGNTPQARGGPAVKDRTCQYCGQAFTSSSLGRHLDQFIFKKKPDGIHDVEEIKKLRGGITRRQARSSKNEVDDAEQLSGTQPKAMNRGVSPLTVPFHDAVPKQGLRISLNALNWQATGVINGLTESSSQSPFSTAAGGTLKRPATSLESSRVDGTEKETIRALELALHEVLETVQAASARAASLPSPFDFDFQAQSYPSLCLLLLPTSSTLLSSYPISSMSSIPLEPPGPQQLDSVRVQVQKLIDKWRNEHTSIVSGSLSDGVNSALGIAHQHTEMARQHIELVYQSWAPLPDAVKQDRWRLEVMKALSREVDRRKEVEEQLHRTEQEARRLQGQVDMLSRCQWPREFALFPPEHRTFSKEMSKAFSATSGTGVHDASAEEYWDYENVVRRWKRVVSDDSARKLGMAASSSRVQPPRSVTPSPGSGITSPSMESTADNRMSASQPKLSTNPYESSPVSKRPRLANGESRSESTFSRDG